jgi:hypothetical protein
MSGPGRYSAFYDDGFFCLRGAIGASAARDMEEAVWSVLSGNGVHRDNRATWSAEHEYRLQAVRKQDRPRRRLPLSAARWMTCSGPGPGKRRRTGGRCC